MNILVYTQCSNMFIWVLYYLLIIYPCSSKKIYNTKFLVRLIYAKSNPDRFQYPIGIVSLQRNTFKILFMGFVIILLYNERCYHRHYHTEAVYNVYVISSINSYFSRTHINIATVMKCTSCTGDGQGAFKTLSVIVNYTWWWKYCYRVLCNV